MVREIIIGILISGSFFLIGIIVTLIGSYISEKQNHKRKLEYLEKETFFKEKLNYFKEILESSEQASLQLAMLIGEFKEPRKDSKRINELISNLDKCSSLYMKSSPYL